MGIGLVIGILLLLAALFVLLWYSVIQAKDFESLSSRDTCRKFLQTLSLKKQILKAGSDISGQCETFIREIDTDKKEEVLAAFAEEMYLCRRNILNSDGTTVLDFKENIGFFRLEDSTCLHCSLITFGDKTKKINKITGAELRQYLYNNPIPGKAEFRPTYAEYFGTDEKNFMNIDDKNEWGDVDYNKDYDVFDQFQTKRSFMGTAGKLATPVIGLIFLKLKIISGLTAVAVGGGLTTFIDVKDQETYVTLAYAEHGSIVGRNPKTNNNYGCAVLN